MPLPQRIRVKISSEAAGYVAMTPVVLQDLDTTDLLGHIVGAAGRDAERVCGILKRGSVVSGASRFRWEPLTAAVADVEAVLALLPGPDPSRAFSSSHCKRFVLAGLGTRLEIAREVAAARKLLRRSTFWDAVLEVATQPEYVTYNHRERADVFRAALDAAASTRLSEAAEMLKYSGLADQVRAAHIDAVEFLVERD